MVCPLLRVNFKANFRAITKMLLAITIVHKTCSLHRGFSVRVSPRFGHFHENLSTITKYLP